MGLTQEQLDQIREEETARLEIRQKLAAESPIAEPLRAPYLWSPGVAAVLSLFIPGAGQIYKQQIFVGFIFMIAAGVPYLYGMLYEKALLAGAIIHIASVIEAATGDPTKSSGGAKSWSPDLPDHAQSTGLSPVWFIILMASLIAVGLWLTN